jgi:hypothetical protein
VVGHYVQYVVVSKQIQRWSWERNAERRNTAKKKNLRQTEIARNAGYLVYLIHHDLI